MLKNWEMRDLVGNVQASVVSFPTHYLMSSVASLFLAAVQSKCDNGFPRNSHGVQPES